MVKIDIPMPNCCAECPLIVKMPYPCVDAVYLCRKGWKELSKHNVSYTRPDFCPIQEDDQVTVK